MSEDGFSTIEMFGYAMCSGVISYGDDSVCDPGEEKG